MTGELVQILIEKQNPNDEFVILHEWKVPTGTVVSANQVVAVVESTKAAYEVTAPVAGYLHYQYQPLDQIPVGVALAVVSAKADFNFSEDKAADIVKSDVPVGSPSLTRKAEKLMAELGLTVADFQGFSVVREADVLTKAKGRPPQLEVPVRKINVEPRKVFEIAALTHSYREVVYSKVAREFNYSNILAQIKEVTKGQFAMTIAEWIAWRAARIMRDFSEFNSYYGDNQICLYEEINIGFALNIGRGLKVPVIRNADRMGPFELSAAVKDFGMKYLRDEFLPQDLSFGTFTITDLSSEGVVDFNPVINQKQSAILGICAQSAIGDVFRLVLAFDHRVTDGLQAARFLAGIAQSAI